MSPKREPEERPRRVRRIAGERTSGRRPAVPGTAPERPEPRWSGASPVPAEEAREPGRVRARLVRAGRALGRVPVQGRRTLLALVVVAAVLAGLLVAAVLGERSRSAEESARVDALAAARLAVVDVLSIDHRDVAASRRKAAAHLAPEFRAEYERFVTQLAATATKNKLVLTTNVVTGGVKDATGDSAVVVLFVDQVSTLATRAQPRIDQIEVRLTMGKHGGTWLVEKLDAL